jgi:hypothetical protein
LIVRDPDKAITLMVVKLLPASLGFVVLTAFAAPAAAQSNYPWCSNFSDGAGANCGFSTYEQCMATARGSGGTCQQNDMYKGPAVETPPRRQARKSRGKNS